MTGKVVVNRAMSLDGFIAGPGHAMEWIFEHSTPGEVPEVMNATGAMLCGRRTYDVGQRDTGKLSGEAYGGLWSGHVFVLTHRPPAPSAVSASSAPPSGPPVTFLSGDVAAAVDRARHAAGGKDLEVLGADVTGQCLARGLIDEIFVLVLPVLLGSGVPFVTGMAGARQPPVRLELVSSERRGQVTAMRLQVRPALRGS